MATGFGHCDCKSYNTFKEQCNDTCKANLPSAGISRSDDGALQISFIDPVTKSNQTEKFFNELGLAAYDRTPHTCQIVNLNQDGMFGFQPKTLSQGRDFFSTGLSRKRRSVATSNPVEIRSPIICITIGQAVVFKVNINNTNRNMSNYPQYKRDHLFNTNPNFDYGNFRQLDTLIRKTNQTITVFVQLFTEPGVHVFYDNAYPARETIVVVPTAGSACDQNVAMDAATTARLTSNSIGAEKVNCVILICNRYFKECLSYFSL